MDKQRKEHIKDILSNIDVDKAPVDFTDNVMQDIYAFSDDELLKEPQLSTLLQNNIIEKPSSNLLNEVMTKIEVSQSISYKPLIGKKAWFIISLAIIGLIAYSILNDSSAQTSSILTEVSPYLNQLKGFFNFSFEGVVLSPVLMISIISLFSLLFVDNFINREVRA